MVTEISGGRFANIYQFDPADEGAAFTCADEIAAKHANEAACDEHRQSEIGEAASRALEAGDWSLLGDMYSDDFVFDDHRRLSSGYLIEEGRQCRHAKRIREQFSVFEPRPLAVRGERGVVLESSGGRCGQ